MQELCWRLKNDLPAYLSTAAAWLSSVELDRNDMADYTEMVLLFWRSNGPKFPAWGRLACAFALDGTLLYRRRAHIFALQPHVRRRPAEHTGRLCAGLAHAAREQALPPLGLNVLIFLG